MKNNFFQFGAAMRRAHAAPLRRTFVQRQWALLRAGGKGAHVHSAALNAWSELRCTVA